MSSEGFCEPEDPEAAPAEGEQRDADTAPSDKVPDRSGGSEGRGWVHG